MVGKSYSATALETMRGGLPPCKETGNNLC
jgi:hypothetical protein